MAFGRAVFRLSLSGIVYDVPPDALEANIFSSGNNVVFRDGLPERASGYAQIYGTPLHEAEYLLNLTDPLVNYWLYPGIDAIAVTDGTDHYDITPAVPLLPTQDYNQWTGGVLNGVPVFNNPFNDPVYWPLDTLVVCAPLPDWPVGTKCMAMRPFKYHLFALNVTDTSGEYPDAVMWSEAAEPGSIPQSWTPLPENDAGFVSLAAGGGAIIDAVQLRDTLVIFKNNSTWLCNYVGGNDVFVFRKSLETSGILAPNCAVEIKGALVVLTDSDLIVFDGQTAKSIIDGRNRKWLFEQLDPTHWRNAFLCKNWLDSEVWVCFPSVGNRIPNVALVWSFDDNSFGIRSIKSPFIASGFVFANDDLGAWDDDPQAWDDDGTIWNVSDYTTSTNTLLASVDGLLMNYNGQNTNNGEVINAYVEKIGIDLEDPQTRKLIKRIWPRIEAPHGTALSIRAGAHDDPNNGVAWSDPVEFLVGIDQKVDTFANGRYLALSLESNSVQPWRMTGFDVEYTTAGAW